MAGTELVVALVALAVSAAALLIAGTQLCGQIFATAEGQRKTTPAVMGKFGELTVRKLKLKDLRFEIQYVSPRLRLSGLSSSSLPGHTSRQIEKDKRLHYGLFYSLKNGVIDEYIGSQPDWQSHGWQQLLYKIRESSKFTGNHDSNGYPGVILQSRPWDSVPDELGKTIATAELFDILVIARRLGAIWQTWNPAVNGLRAEGNGHVFISTDIRGLGMAFLYQYQGVAQNKVKTKSKLTEWRAATYDTVQAWTSDANKFMFGICPGNDDFDLKDFVIRTREDLVLVLSDDGYLDLPWQAPKNRKAGEASWKERLKRSDMSFIRKATNDLIALSCPMIRFVAGPLSPDHQGRVLLSFADVFENTFQGYRIEGDYPGRKNFLRRFEEHAIQASSIHLLQVLDHARALINQEFSGNHIALADLSAWLDKACKGYEETTAYFRKVGDRLPEDHRSGRTSEERASNFYWHLMRAHLSRSGFLLYEATQIVRNERPDIKRDGEQRQHRLGHVMVDLYFEEIEAFQTFMEAKNFGDRALVAEAWMVLFFRGMCWSLCHTAEETGAFLPVELYGSRLPVSLI